MRPELKSKFIQYLNYQKNDEGFTLIELLAVIMIVGILAAIAIPNLLNQDVKAKQTEAKQNIALVNKAQNAYRAENSTFASSFDILAIGSVTGGTTGTTTNYVYGLTQTIATDSAVVTGSPNDAALRAFSGGNTRFTNGSNMNVIGTVMCETIVVGATATPPTITAGTRPTCTAAQITLSL